MLDATLKVALLPGQTVAGSGCSDITGNCGSFTVTVNVQVATEQTLVAVKVTVVTPVWKAVPLPVPTPLPVVAPLRL